MSESMRFITAGESDAWNSWLEEAPHDFYHTAAYHRLAEQSGEGEAWLAVCGDRRRFLAWPYLVRRLDNTLQGRLDITSVYGYAGPVGAGCSPGDDWVERAWEGLRDHWSRQGVVTAFTRFHPLLGNHLWAPGGAVAEGETVAIDLTLGEAVNWHDYQASLRNRINRGRRIGLGTEVDPDWSHLPDFYRFYCATMRRNQASRRYWFSLDYFRGLQRALGAHGFLLVTRLGGAIAAAGIFAEYGGMMHNHFSMNNQEWLELGPTKVLLDDARRWAMGRGNKFLHLGGGRGSRPDSLFGFKAAYSPLRRRFYTGRWILDEGVYRGLCGQQPAGVAGFFPAYRVGEERAAVGVS